MNAEEVTSTIRGFIVKELLSGDDNGLEPTTDLLKTGLIDSMSILMLTDFIAKTYSIDVPPDNLTPSNLRSLNTITKMVLSLGARVG